MREKKGANIMVEKLAHTRLVNCKTAPMSIEGLVPDSRAMTVASGEMTRVIPMLRDPMAA